MFFDVNEDLNMFVKYFNELCNDLSDFVLDCFLNDYVASIEDGKLNVNLDKLSANIDTIFLNDEALKHNIISVRKLYQNVLKQNSHNTKISFFIENQELIKKILDVSIEVELAIYRICIDYLMHTSKTHDFILPFINDDFILLFKNFEKFKELLEELANNISNRR